MGEGGVTSIRSLILRATIRWGERAALLRNASASKAKEDD
jgi:hypothetical protein